MELKKFASQLMKTSNSIIEIEKSLLYVFCIKSHCDFSDSKFVTSYFSDIDNNIVEKVQTLAVNYEYAFEIYSLIELFELLIPSEESKKNGMVYTPTFIKNYILKSTLTFENAPTVCDPACGCGSFLISAAEYIHEKYQLEFNEIFKNHIFGVDIIAHNIDKCKMLFHILALLHNEVIKVDFNLDVGNSLIYDWQKGFDNISDGEFDCVIGNPPYVRSKNLPNDIKESLKLWGTSQSGNIDLYIPFYELGYKLLRKNGKLGYISPNTFLQSVNGRKLRAFLKNSKCDISILDFRETQIFKNVTSYTCIALIDKVKKNGIISYALLNGKASLDDYKFTTYSYSDFEGILPWRMSNKSIDERIKKIENIGIKLDSYKIRNGMATLKNDVYFFTPTSEDETFYYRNYKNSEYKIEKNICIDVVKPNVIKTEKELIDKMEKAIFPYSVDGIKCLIMSETTLKKEYPNTYVFFKVAKDDLSKRDKGKGAYPEWYAYGRTQGMLNFGKKLLLPYISGEPAAVLSFDPNILFYCGYAIFSEDETELLVLKKILESDVFWYYISNTSKPYSKGYMSLAKNYIRNFGIPILTKEQKRKLLSLKKLSNINDYITELYGLNVCN